MLSGDSNTNDLLIDRFQLRHTTLEMLEIGTCLKPFFAHNFEFVVELAKTIFHLFVLALQMRFHLIHSSFDPVHSRALFLQKAEDELLVIPDFRPQWIRDSVFSK